MTQQKTEIGHISLDPLKKVILPKKFSLILSHDKLLRSPTGVHHHIRFIRVNLMTVPCLSIPLESGGFIKKIEATIPQAQTYFNHQFDLTK